MKLLTQSLLIAFLSVCLISCGGKESAKESTPSTNSGTQVQSPPAQANKTINIPPGTKHYICANNCEGSGGDLAGNCPICGNPYTHNSAFHGNIDNSSIQVPPDVTIKSSDYNKPPPTQTNAPAKNAQGVFHYVCTKAGCAGGAGVAGNCGTCGSGLAHNAAYHK